MVRSPNLKRCQGGISDPRRAPEGVRRRQRRHRPALHRRHGGTAAGQAADRGALPRRRGRARRRGLQLPARRRRRHGHRRGLRDVLLGARLRRLRDEARLRHPAPDPLARGHRAADGGPRLGGRLRRRRLAAPDPPAPTRPARRARLEGDGGHRARVHRLSRHLRGGVEEGLYGPRPGESLQRRLLDARNRPGRAADPADPQLDDGRGNAGRELEGRVQLRPARDQLPLRRARSAPPTIT